MVESDDVVFPPEHQRKLDAMDCMDQMIAFWCKLGLRRWEDVKFYKLPEDWLWDYANKFIVEKK